MHKFLPLVYIFFALHVVKCCLLYVYNRRLNPAIHVGDLLSYIFLTFIFQLYIEPKPADNRYATLRGWVILFHRSVMAACVISAGIGFGKILHLF